MNSTSVLLQYEFSNLDCRLLLYSTHDNTAPYTITPVATSICLLLFFNCHFITAGTLKTTSRSEVGLKAAPRSKPTTPGRHNQSTTPTGMDTGTNLEPTATPRRNGSGPITALVVTNQRNCYGVTVTAGLCFTSSGSVSLE